MKDGKFHDTDLCQEALDNNEVFKKENVVDGKVLYTNSDRLDSNNILKFY